MRKHPREAAAPKTSPYLRAASILICLGIIAVSTAISTGVVDAFRLPKEIVFRAEAILLIGLGVFAATERRGRWRDLVEGIAARELLLCAAVLFWTIVTTILSSNRLLSIQSTITVTASIVVFVGTRRLAPELSWRLLDVCFIVAAANSVLIALQEYGIWNPFAFPDTFVGHVRSTALIGHPDDVGAFLLAPALAAVVGAYVSRGVRRWVYLAAAIVLVSGIVTTGSRAVLVALLAGGIAFALYRPWKQALVALLAIVIVAAVAFNTSSVIRERSQMLVDAARQRQYDVLFSERLVPFLTAIDMIRSDPLTGVGPGCFKYHYMDERLALAGHYPASWTRSWPENFGETHNDHLQVTAETGVPGYALFLIALLLLGKVRRPAPGEPDPPQRRFGRLIRIPLVTAFFIVALAQFPLQIAAPRLMFLTFAAVALGWDPHDA